MWRLAFFIAVLFSVCLLHAAADADSAEPGMRCAGSGCWRIDHYLDDVALHRRWAVLVDCDHPDAPARVVPAGRATGGAACQARPAATVRGGSQSRSANAGVGGSTTRRWSTPEIKAGAEVEVESPAGASARFLLSGKAIEPGYAGHAIRVRLNATRSIVRAGVRGPHLAVLIASHEPAWRRQ